METVQDSTLPSGPSSARRRSSYGSRVIGIADGFEGLIEKRYRELTPGDTRGILRVGGTILGSSNRTDPWNYTPPGESTAIDATAAAYETLDEIGADALVVIGGDGTLFLTHKFAGGRFPVVGIPKTIDNDVHGTDYAIGFDTCVATVTDAIDKLHTTAESHHRVMLVEVMGTHCRLDRPLRRHRGWRGRRPDAGTRTELRYTLSDSRSKRSRHDNALAGTSRSSSSPKASLGRPASRSSGRPNRAINTPGSWVASVTRSPTELGKLTKREVRALVLGHLQRGGSPTSTDRILATKLAHAATDARAPGIDGVMAGVRGHPASSSSRSTRSRSGRGSFQQMNRCCTAAQSIGDVRWLSQTRSCRPASCRHDLLGRLHRLLRHRRPAMF